jgi:cold shock CspA family protein
MAEDAGLPETQPVSEEVYVGTVKSYNERRGFGFIACADTVTLYGRDVYMARAEAQLATPGGTGLAEEDAVRFRVRLSVEGFPQAAHVQRLRRFQGVVVQPPTGGGSSSAAEAVGRLRSSELEEAFGAEVAVPLSKEACGQACLFAGDEVTFCMPEGASGGHSSNEKGGAQVHEPALVVLARTLRPTGFVLGCFQLRLPRPPVAVRPARGDLLLDCHAFDDKIILAGLPLDVGDAELMRFFSKQGATGAIVARARGGCGYASVAFPSLAEVARLLGRRIHAFADENETRVATLLDCQSSDCALPALPAPVLSAGEGFGTLLVTWSPVAIASGYCVELRPAGVQASWDAVPDSQGNLRDAGCSACKVAGLPCNTVFEARVSYFTSCGSRAEASDSSEWCVPSSPAPALSNCTPPVVQAVGIAGHIGMDPVSKAWPANAPAVPKSACNTGGVAWPAWQQGGSTSVAPGECPPAPVNMAGVLSEYHQCSSLGVMQNMLGLLPGSEGSEVLQNSISSPAWRCSHGTMISTAPMPELRWLDNSSNSGPALIVQWQAAAHAAAYMVEVYEEGSAVVDRIPFMAPGAMPGSLIELQLNGSKPLAEQRYRVQLRCISTCGCESAPSSAAWSPPQRAGAGPEVHKVASMPGICAAGGAAAAMLGGGGGGADGGEDGPSAAPLPRLLRSPGEPPMPPPAGSAICQPGRSDFLFLD